MLLARHELSAAGTAAAWLVPMKAETSARRTTAILEELTCGEPRYRLTKRGISTGHRRPKFAFGPISVEKFSCEQQQAAIFRCPGMRSRRPRRPARGSDRLRGMADDPAPAATAAQSKILVHITASSPAQREQVQYSHIDRTMRWQNLETSTATHLL